MKFVAGILAFTILFLSVQPAFASLVSTVEVECNSECCPHDSKPAADDTHPEEGCSDFCNPLLKCGTSALGNMSFLHFSIDTPVLLLTKPGVYTPSFFSQFSPDFWQPPKLA